uniref:DNA ligase n=1 Tax=Erinnyis ello granulovirus TaxID=307444 RepID=A0A288WJ54_9BBAC|nr:DNA ligase [Erinnyis ello granulovirus]
MLFSTFAKIHNTITGMGSVSDISSYINKTVDSSMKNELYMWLYLMSTFDKKFKINDKHILTVFSKIQEPHIDRKNLHEAFKTNGVANTCSTIVKLNDVVENPLTMVDVYKFLQQLQDIPSKSFYLMRHFKNILPQCDKHTLYCLLVLIRNTSKNKKLQTKKRNLYLFRQVLGRKGLKEVDVYMQDLKKTNINMRDCIKPGKPIESMLAQPCKVFEAINIKNMCVEVKYNGERIQVHKYSNNVTCYKRNLNVNMKCGELTNTIQRVLRDVDNVILDCELIGSCVNTYQIVVFDVLYYNGVCLINEPLSARKSVLDRIMVKEESQMMNVKYEVTSNRDDVERWVNTLLKLDNLEEEEEIEGVVIKDWNGVYEPKRKKWLKIKRSYFKNVCSADLVVVGGWRSNKSITIYLVATPFKDDQDNIMFLPVSKVKYSKNNYEHLMKPYNSNQCKWLVVNEHLKTLNKIPDMVAKNPFTMPVWEMQGDFIRSDKVWSWNSVERNYVSIRLPRFIKVRDDKTYKQANTIFDLLLMSTITNKSFCYTALYDFYIKDNIINYSPNTV